MLENGISALDSGLTDWTVERESVKYGNYVD